MKIQVRYFASLRETIGFAAEAVDTACEDVASLRLELIARGGAYSECLAIGRPVRVAVNQVMAHDATPLSDHGEVAFFPPVTGG
ncbi:molybdopterin converting factor subunit 1 [Limnohabitans sp. 2KL-17]|uniref:molybdopterin converting factor subunit 1 n=1 Tax=Limnohabitans sp. 2KL-17 TaxID=1100704 RepID=UPI000D355F99|nr:molybdopterin converting factor subunit 1 [Limnohabitans sp. 2KL-17]PUE52994.1 molybdopterin converting factor subunit 1 [Limnohabitans sp. 2KL-17]